MKFNVQIIYIYYINFIYLFVVLMYNYLYLSCVCRVKWLMLCLAGVRRPAHQDPSLDHRRDRRQDLNRHRHSRAGGAALKHRYAAQEYGKTAATNRCWTVGKLS